MWGPAEVDQCLQPCFFERRVARGRGETGGEIRGRAGRGQGIRGGGLSCPEELGQYIGRAPAALFLRAPHRARARVHPPPSPPTRLAWRETRPPPAIPAGRVGKQKAGWAMEIRVRREFRRLSPPSLARDPSPPANHGGSVKQGGQVWIRRWEFWQGRTRERERMVRALNCEMTSTSCSDSRRKYGSDERGSEEGEGKEGRRGRQRRAEAEKGGEGS